MSPKLPPTQLNELPVRWLVLALQSLAVIGAYYCYDNPTATYNQVCRRLPLTFPRGLRQAFLELHSARAKMETYFNITSSSSKSDSNAFNFNYNLLYSVYSFPNFVRAVTALGGTSWSASFQACCAWLL